MSSRATSRSRFLLGATLLLLACKDTTAPRVPGTMSAHSAITQSARAGSAVSDAPAVLVLDQDAQPLSGATVSFTVVEGGGSVTGSPATTDAAGVAHLASWTLGSEGVKNLVRAKVGGMTTDFEATALVAATLEIASAQSQAARAGTQVPSAPAVRVLDQNGQPLAGATVSFAVTAGGGTVSSPSTATDAAGVARLTGWTLGNDGVKNVVRASVGSVSADFEAIALVASSLEITSAQSQQAVVGTVVASVPAVRVLDQFGQPLAGIAVAFQLVSGGGALVGTAATSDANGIATSGAWALGHIVGANTVAASVGALTVSFAATGIAGPAARLVYMSGTQQTGTVHTTLAAPFTAKVTDQYGNVVKGTSVALAVTAGQNVGASVSSPSVVSGDDGVVQAYLTLGDSAGANEMSMAAAGLQNSPIVFTATADWRRLKAGSVSGRSAHACAAGLDGRAYCWGYNADGQLGDGTKTNRAIATRVGADVNLVSATAGIATSCGLDATGKAFCWGNNSVGALGNGTFTESTVPVAVSGGLAFRALSAGFMHTCGLTMTDSVYCWGTNQQGELGIGSPNVNSSAPMAVQGGLSVRTVSTGFSHACVLTTSGTVYCWGYNGYGEVGTGDTTVRHDTPMAIASQGRTFIAVAAGWYNTCALDQEGAAWCWGRNQYGELGIPTTTTASNIPVAVGGGLHFTQLFGTIGRYCGLVTSGEMYCWGSLPSTIGSPGPSPTPRQVPALTGLGSLAGADSWLCGVRAEGDAVCVGQNDKGQLGDGVLDFHLRSTPERVRAP